MSKQQALITALHAVALNTTETAKHQPQREKIVLARLFLVQHQDGDPNCLRKSYRNKPLQRLANDTNDDVSVQHLWLISYH